MLADAGVGHLNEQVDELIDAGVLRRVLAFTELTFSNAMIEGGGGLCPRANHVLPHSALRGQTPDEMYCGTGEAVAVDLTSRAAAARAFA